MDEPVGAHLRVLVVEDDPDHRQLMAASLARADVHVATAGDGATALGAVGGQDVVVVDYRLPDCSGLDLASAIRELSDPPAVVLVTAQGSADVAVQALRDGAADYVTKDATYLRELPAVVDRAWRQHDLRRRARELQRLALLVSDAANVADAGTQIVEGARKLLRASRAVIAVEFNGALRVVATAGEASTDVATELDRMRRTIPPPGGGAILDDGTVITSLPVNDDEPLGVLVVSGVPQHGELMHDELELARTFASFAGTALRTARRQEIEHALVSELQRTMEGRRDFVASVSHELRTPLTLIGGYAETVLTRWDDLSDDTRREFIGHVRGHARQLSQVVEELLDLASLERGRSLASQPRPLSLRETVATAVEEMADLVGTREVRVELPEAEIVADPTLLQRSLANLVSNAIKYSPPATVVDIAATVADQHVRISVTDHGIGLSAGDAARIFEPFFRTTTSVSNAVRGSGIGLALVREYVRTMGGEVEVETEPGVGSTFSFTVPLADTPAR